MRQTFTTRVMALFQAHENQWIDARDLEAVGGRQAWRSRVSNCRTQFGMHIENRLRSVPFKDGTRYTVSEYRYQKEERTDVISHVALLGMVSAESRRV